jgi:endonuclease/exonuclease/phosphatase family metal-dependent hydrolase
MDGRYAPERIITILMELRADIVAVQEADIGILSPSGECQVTTLSNALGYQGISGATLKGGRRDYGNALLTRHPVLAIRYLDLSVPGFEPRAALDVDLRVQNQTLRVLATHLGLRQRERRIQIFRLLAAVKRTQKPGQACILMGDFNFWLPLNSLTRHIEATFQKAAPVRTYTAARPLLPLDRIWVRRPGRLEDLRSYRTRLSRIASDHLPLLGQISLPAGDTETTNLYLAE